MADFKRILGAVTTGALLALPLFASAQTRFVWGNRFNSISNDYDSAAAATVDLNGNLIVVGSSVSPTTGMDFLISKFNYKGFTAFAKTASSSTTAANLSVPWGAGWEGGKAVDTDSLGAIWVTGEAYIAGGAHVAPLYKYDPRGIQKFAVNIGGTSASSMATGNLLTVLADDSVLVAGTKNDSGQTAGFVNKYDTNGALLWSKKVAQSATSADSISGWTLDASGNIFVTGRTTTNGNADLFTTKLAADGTVVWSTKYSTDGTDYGLQVSLDSAGNVITLGQTNGKAKGNDYVVVKLNSAGTQVWATAYDAQGTRKDDIARNLLVGSDNSVYVTGSTVAGNTYFNTVRFSSAGSLLQTNRISISAATAQPGLEQNPDGSVVLTLTTLTATSTPQLSIYSFKADLTAPVIERWQLSNGANSVQFITAGLISGARNVFAIGDNGVSAGATSDISIIRIAPTAVGVTKYNAGKDIQLDVPVANGLQKYNTIVGKGVVATTSLLDPASNGTVTVNPDGSFSYLPNAEFLGADSFNFKTVAGAWESDWRTSTVTTAKMKLKIAVTPEKVGSTLVIHVTLTNSSTSVTIPSVSCDSALLGSSTVPVTTLPLALGSLAPASSVTFDLVFAGRPAGQKLQVKVNGSFQGDTFAVGAAIVTP